MDAVAPGLGPHVVDRVADPLRAALEEPVLPGDAEAEGVDQRVARVAGLEGHLAAHRRAAEGIAVAADAGHHAGQDAARPRVVERPEAQRVHDRDRPRAHGEDVAQDAAHARGRALVGLDERGVVVRLDLEHRHQAVADVHRAGVLAGPLHHPGTGGRQGLEVDAARLVRAVLRPHDREEPQLGQVGLAPQQAHDAVVLFGLEVVLREDFGGDGHGAEDSILIPPGARP